MLMRCIRIQTRPQDPKVPLMAAHLNLDSSHLLKVPVVAQQSKYRWIR